MTYQAIATLAASAGLPTAYYQFPMAEAQAPPFLVWLITGSADEYADNSNYQRIETCQFELYTDAKDFALEQTVEAALSGAGLTWRKDEGFLDSERMHMTTYQFQVVITAAQAEEE